MNITEIAKTKINDAVSSLRVANPHVNLHDKQISLVKDSFDYVAIDTNESNCSYPPRLR